MWLEQLCERTYDEMNHCLSLGHDEQQRLDVLQQLCTQLTGRNSTRDERQYLLQGSLLEFEVILHGYLMERRSILRAGKPLSIVPPSGVVRKVGRSFRAVAVPSNLHAAAIGRPVGVAALLDLTRESMPVLTEWASSTQADSAGASRTDLAIEEPTEHEPGVRGLSTTLMNGQARTSSEFVSLPRLTAALRGAPRGDSLLATSLSHPLDNPPQANTLW